MGGPHIASDCLHTGKIDDTTPTAFNHFRHAHPKQPEGGLQIGVYNAVPLCFVHFEKIGMGADRRVVYEHIYAAKGVMSLSNQAFRVFAITKIGQHIDNVAARLLDFSRNRLAGRFVCFPVNDNFETVAGKFLCDGSTDASARTSIENLYVCDASVIPEPWGLPPVLTCIGLGKRLARQILN